MEVSSETVRHINHEQREICRIGDPGGRDVHAVFQTPVLCGISEVKLALATAALVVSSCVVGDLLVAAAQDNMPPALRLQGHLGDDDDMQRLCECLVEPWRLVQTGLEVPRHSGLFAVVCRDMVVLQLVAIRAMRPPPGIGASRGEVQRRLASQLGNQGQGGLPRHLQGVVVAKVPVQHQGGQRDLPRDEGQQGLERTSDAPELRRESHVGFGLVLAALWTSRATLCGGRCLLLRFRFGLAGNVLRGGTDALLDSERERAALLSADP